MTVIRLFCFSIFFFHSCTCHALLILVLFIQQAGLAKLIGLAGETNVQVSLL